MQSTNITGYQYSNEADAISAITACNTFYGMPKPPTFNWCEYQTADLDTPVFYYITADDSLIPVLGFGSTFTITQPDLPW